MEINESHIKECLNRIERKLNWGDGKQWTTRDYQNLSERIFEETGITLSVATLKRIWGKVSYNSNPTITTLDTLVKYVGFDDWRNFQNSLSTSPPEIKKQSPKSKTTKFAIGSLGKLTVLVSLLFLLGWKQFKVPEIPFTPLNINSFSFGSKKMVTKGVPNSVIFEYDALSADERDIIKIQQSWDERRSTIVPKDETIHNSIYYHPGYFRAKLVVRDTIVKQHDIFIKSDGWLPLIDRGLNTPIYFEESEAFRGDGSFYISSDQIEQKNVNMHPETPWLNYYYMDDLEDLTTRDFVLETRFKNEYAEGAGKCQKSLIELRFAGGVFQVPFSSPGCVGGLKMNDFSGDIKDLSSLGVNLSEWVNVRIVAIQGKGKLFINHAFAMDLNFDSMPLELKGIRFQFQGGGEIDEVSFRKPNNELVFEEKF